MFKKILVPTDGSSQAALAASTGGAPDNNEEASHHAPVPGLSLYRAPERLTPQIPLFE